MRTLLISKATTLADLAQALLPKTQPAAARASVLAQLRQLNPQVDPKRVPEGTVLLLPDGPANPDADSQPLGGEALLSLQASALGGLQAAAQSARVNAEARAAEAEGTAAILQDTAFRRIAESDKQLAEQANQAHAQLKLEEQQARDKEQAIQALGAQVAAEFAALAELFRLPGPR